MPCPIRNNTLCKFCIQGISGRKGWVYAEGIERSVGIILIICFFCHHRVSFLTLCFFLSFACSCPVLTSIMSWDQNFLPWELDAVFEAKEELALAVKNALSETMTGYGYQILQALITDLDPDQRAVKNAMDEINSSKRLKFAVAKRAKGDKILQVKTAEAEAEAKYLSGVGVAKQRKAIVDGLKASIVDFSNNGSGSSTKEVMDLLLLTQYFELPNNNGTQKAHHG
jgi:hypothetical protein